MVKKLVHLEGLVMFLAMIYIYSVYDFNWWLFLLLVLAPDVSMVAYLINNQVGSKIYNLFHTYTISVFIILVGFFLQLEVFLIIGLIWTAHIGMDRLFGYGLKYSTSFQDTHFQRL